MNTRIAIRVGALLGLSWSMATACASKTEGTDSNTHWIVCTTVADCPNTSAFACVDNRCQEIRDSGSRGTGGAPGSGGGISQGTGGRPAAGTGGTAAAGTGGALMGGAAGTGGAAGSSTGGSNAADAATGDCMPMDARTGQLDCATVIGYTFTGVDCEPVVCSCLGADCEKIWKTEQECRAYRSACLGSSTVSNECIHNSDCTLVDRVCCLPCGEPVMTDKVAVNVASATEWRGMVCRNPIACPPCVPPPGPFQSVCIEGRCKVQNQNDAKACAQSSDCRVVPVDCCACGALTLWTDVMTINASTTPTCPATCSPCPGGVQLPPDIHAACSGAGYCVLQ